MRVVRPGSVIGPQQFFLGEKQAAMWRAGDGVGAHRLERSSAAAAAGIVRSDPGNGGNGADSAVDLQLTEWAGRGNQQKAAAAAAAAAESVPARIDANHAHYTHA